MRVVISGYYGFGNTGDEAILRAIVNSMKSERPDLDIIVLSNNPAETAKMHDVKAINRMDIRSIWTTLSHSDMLISGGGGLLQDVTSFRNILYYSGIIYMAWLLKKPIMYYANGVGPINIGFNRLLVRNISNKAQVITVRDLLSKRQLDEIGVKTDVFITADPAFLLKVPEDINVEDIYEKEGIPLNNKILGISIRKWKNFDYVKEALKDFVNKVRNIEDFNIVFLPMQKNEDLRACEEISRDLERSYVIKGNYDVYEVLGIVSKFDYMIGMRLHAMIFSVLNGVPVIGISYDPKIDNFFNIIGQQYLNHIDEVNSERLLNQFLDVVMHKNEISRCLKRKAEELRQKAMENNKIAFSVLERQRWLHD
ncbi:polysaccharide pyruvyl transferase CsaB [Caldanaerobius fijiensis DSM 17918]|uniref:Polysaccharide pyruvyl transferase CsaB n=1 Tax=Caldanaerobius fijiensis DSM 17918 TaxID=1121256 RepID=A0A1M5EFF7_9THEO|nr:polysaccharide pyruvyl transferase CsaB [Caldanaerobius fijiensis]SHF77801.1 polysaccharide pyruvyl transferase CsaB [Caldanaerobius fijiensis DSM 17918]